MITPQPRKNEQDITPDVLANRGKRYFANGQRYQAQKAFAEAILLAPDNVEYKAMLVQALTGQVFLQYDDLIKQAISICLRDDNIRHLPLLFTWHSLVLLAPDTKDFSSLEKCGNYDSFLQNFSVFDALNDPFLHQGLKKLLMKDYNFERLLTHIRRYALLEATSTQLQDMSSFLMALSAQCFFNEYIFYVTEEEQKKIDDMSKNATTLDWMDVVLLSCYRPLYQVENVESPLHILKHSENGEIENLIRLQIFEPLHERNLKKNIKSFGRIADGISQAVQEQYEENPFPRWVSCGSEKADSQKDLSAGHKILIAGCGTGQQAVTAAMNFPQASITAIDLSKTSLTYAQRKAQEYGLENLSFLHGDILEVSDIGEEFDYIACGGVLHHMAVPKDGFMALKDVLKDDGIMRIGVYSEIARQNIVAVQKWIEEKKFPPTPNGIREFRKDFIEGGYKNVFDGALPYFDIFSISETRDLFFHVQEHRFTCLQLKELLEQIGMDLLIFAPESYAAHQRFRQLFPDDPHAVNLENWHRIEQNNPGLFIGMYKFYIAKAGQHEPGKIPEWLRV